MFKIDENSIDEFKKPLGKLYVDFEDAIPMIKEASFLISVGDQTTKNLVDIDLIPDLGIIDKIIVFNVKIIIMILFVQKTF